MLNRNLIALLVWLFSSALLANTWYATKELPLRADRLSSAKTLTTIEQGQSLELLTMHFSGWSQVRLDDQIGWVATQSLTQEKPTGLIAVANTQIETDKQQKVIHQLNQEIIVLKQEMSDLGLSKNKQIETLKGQLKAQIEALNLQNQTLESSVNQQQPIWFSVTGDTRTDSIIIVLLSLLIGLLFGLFVSKIKRRKDTFNTINRSY